MKVLLGNPTRAVEVPGPVTVSVLVEQPGFLQQRCRDQVARASPAGPVALRPRRAAGP